MSKVRTEGTDLELTVRSELHRRGLRFRKNVKTLPGSPDIVFPKAKLAVFLDGDFWHGYDFDTRKIKLTPFWQAKIAATIERDRRNNVALTSAGWLVLRFWQHEIKKNNDAVVADIEAALRERTA